MFHKMLKMDVFWNVFVIDAKMYQWGGEMGTWVSYTFSVFLLYALKALASSLGGFFRRMIFCNSLNRIVAHFLLKHLVGTPRHSGQVMC